MRRELDANSWRPNNDDKIQTLSTNFLRRELFLDAETVLGPGRYLGHHRFVAVGALKSIHQTDGGSLISTRRRGNDCQSGRKPASFLAGVCGARRESHAGIPISRSDQFTWGPILC